MKAKTTGHGIEYITLPGHESQYARTPTGTITHGTMRACDVLPALGTWIACYASGEPRERYRAIVAWADENDPDLAATLCGTPDRYSEHNTETICDFIHIINDCLPEGWVCGSHPGDGSDIGIWPTDLLY